MGCFWDILKYYGRIETGTKEVKYEAISDWRGGGRNKGCGEI